MLWRWPLLFSVTSSLVHQLLALLCCLIRIPTNMNTSRSSPQAVRSYRPNYLTNKARVHISTNHLTTDWIFLALRLCYIFFLSPTAAYARSPQSAPAKMQPWEMAENGFFWIREVNARGRQCVYLKAETQGQTLGTLNVAEGAKNRCLLSKPPLGKVLSMDSGLEHWWIEHVTSRQLEDIFCNVPKTWFEAPKTRGSVLEINR